MSSNKNIDRLFQERFKNFEAQAPDAAWDAIKQQLDDNKTIVTIPLWLKALVVAAGFAIIATITHVAYNQLDNQPIIDQPAVTTVDDNKPSTNDIDATDQYNTTDNRVHNNNASDHNNLDKTITLEQPKSINQSKNIADSITNESNHNSNQNNYPTVSNNKILTTNKTINTKKSQKNPTINLVTQDIKQLDNGTKIVDNTSDPNQSKTKQTTTHYNNNAPTGYKSIYTTKPTNKPTTPLTTQQQSNHNDNSIPYASVNIKTSLVNTKPIHNTKPSDTTLDNLKLLASHNTSTADKKSKSKPETYNKWSVSSMIAPIYSTAFSGSSIDPKFNDNDKTSGVNLSLGISVAYQLSPRWSLQSGVHRLNMSYTTNDIIYGIPSQDLNFRSTTMTAFNPDAVYDAGYDPINQFALPVDQEFIDNDNFTGMVGDISQQLGYIEVPIEASYKVIDRKISVHLTAGMSALFLTDNNVVVTNNRTKIELGPDDNFNTFNQSANLGIGLDYKLSDQLGLTMQPMFKYQLNTLNNNTANFKPYNLGVYSGIFYRF